MKNLYIIGAGGCGREVLQIVKDINRIQGPTWNIMGFLDDTESPLKGIECDYGVVGTIKDFVPGENDVAVMAIASPQAKKMLVPQLKARGVSFATVIHPNAFIGEFCKIGEGAVVYNGFHMTVNIQIGDFATLLGCRIGHDVSIGDYCTISGYCNILGHVKIGNGVFFGSTCQVIPYTVVEDDAYIGVGSVVIRRVKAGKRVFGNPAKEMNF